MKQPSFCVSLPKKSYTVEEFNVLVYFCQLCVRELGCASIKIDLDNQDRIFLKGDLKDLSPMAQKYYDAWLKYGNVIKMEVIK